MDPFEKSSEHYSNSNVMLRHRCLRQTYVCRRHLSQNVNASRPLEGKFIGVKGNIVTKTSVVPSTAASKTLENYHSPFHATIVQRLIDNGANILPNSNMDEFGMGSHSQFSHLGLVESLYKRGGIPLSPGGSSGGSAAWVAAKLCWAALGTDTGGSVRLPAAYMGVVGFKPSYGRVSRWGVIQYANSLDTVGILAETVGDVRGMFGVIDGSDERDPTSLGERVRERMRKRMRKERRLRIGVPTEYNIAELSPVVKETYMATLHALQEAGHELQAVSLPSTRRALSAYYVLAPAEASSNLAKYDGIRYGHRTSTSDASPHADPPLPLYAQTRGESFGDEVKRRILLGAYTLSSEAIDNYFIQAQKVRRIVQQDFDKVFAQHNPLMDQTTQEEEDGRVDVLLTPTAPSLPPTIEELKSQSPVESYMNDVLTVPASLAGLPAISVPVPLPGKQLAGMDDEDVKTAGMQLIAQFGDDELLLDMAEELAGLNWSWSRYIALCANKISKDAST